MSAAIEVLLTTLRRRREREGVTQAVIAERMGTTQNQVSEIERNVNDALLSTLQRYHRAVTGEPLKIRLSFEVDMYPAPPHKRTDFAIAS